MAFRKITEGDMLGKGNVGRPDTPGVSTAEMQRIMDELPREVLAPAFNELAGQLEAETAAADIGAAAPEGVTAAPAGKLQAVLNGLRDLVKAHTDRADNPHGVTAAQAGAYSKAETDAAISAKVVELGAGDMAKSIYDPGNEQQPLLPRNGDGSNVTVSFTEAEQDADIQTGEKLTVLFGKIKKRFSTYDADGDGVVDEAAAAPWSGITGKPDTFRRPHITTTTAITPKPKRIPSWQARLTAVILIAKIRWGLEMWTTQLTRIKPYWKPTG